MPAWTVTRTFTPASQSNSSFFAGESLLARTQGVLPELDEDGDWQRLFLERLCAPW